MYTRSLFADRFVLRTRPAPCTRRVGEKRMRTTPRSLAALWCAVVLAGCPTGTTTTTTTTTSTTTSTVSTTTLSPDHTAPSAPSALTATPQSCGRIDLAWTGSTDTGGSG